MCCFLYALCFPEKLTLLQEIEEIHIPFMDILPFISLAIYLIVFPVAFYFHRQFRTKPSDLVLSVPSSAIGSTSKMVIVARRDVGLSAADVASMAADCACRCILEVAQSPSPSRVAAYKAWKRRGVKKVMLRCDAAADFDKVIQLSAANQMICVTASHNHVPVVCAIGPAAEIDFQFTHALKLFS